MARVLLAADVEPVSNRVVARLALEEAGYTVDEVHDGFDALAVADSTRPDVLVLDTNLPGLDGFQVLDRLHRHPALRHLPVVMLSTMPRDVGGELAHSLGAVRFLPRPFTNADLGEAVALARGAQAPTASPAAGGRAVAEWGELLADALRDRQAAAPPSVVDLPLPRRARAPRRRPRGA
ncbi:MAG TPA: response regulator [Chloroflexota bacterium]|nr:response regulator [Chloroflexota bacterium]